MKRIVWVVLLLAVGAANGWAAGEDDGDGWAVRTREAGLVRATVAADSSALVPGKEVQVAVTLTIAPGHHVYWSNPGDAGLPTAVEWKLPKGFMASALRFPLPTAFDQPGGIRGYGYAGTVTFLATVQVPAEAKVGEETPLTGMVTWLCCDEKGCVPGAAKVSLTLPVAEKAVGANEKLFAAALEKMPLAKRPAAAKDVALAVEPALPGFTSRAVITWDAPVAAVEAFPEAAAGVEVSNVAIKNAGKTSEVVLSWRVLAGEKKVPETLPVLIVATDAAGKRTGFFEAFGLAKPKAR